MGFNSCVILEAVQLAGWKESISKGGQAYRKMSEPLIAAAPVDWVRTGAVLAINSAIEINDRLKLREAGPAIIELFPVLE